MIQNMNRFSYVLNNPMSYTDPSGYFHMWAPNSGKKAIRGVMRALGQDVSQALISIGCAYTGTGAPACYGYMNYNLTRAFGGSPGDALKSGAQAAGTAWMFQQIGDQFTTKNCRSCYKHNAKGDFFNWNKRAGNKNCKFSFGTIFNACYCRRYHFKNSR